MEPLREDLRDGTRGRSPSRKEEDATLLGILDACEEKLRRGEAIDRDEILREHPALRERLAACLSGLELVRRAGRALEVGAAPEGSGSSLSLLALGDFRILREVGRGGMGIVYEAEQVSLSRRVALKVLPYAAALDPRKIQRFKNEAMVAAHLHHTGIVPVFAVGYEEGVHYFAMQFIEGRTLEELVGEERDARRKEGGDPGRTGARGSFERAARLGLQAAEALEHAHELGVLHRDIKPANLILDPRGNLWVTDFGLARLELEPGLTLSGDMLGTLRYMSPEQARARRAAVDHRSDLYSLGATLYEILTLEPAFPGNEREALLRQIALEEPRAPRRLRRDLPRDLETIVLKAMAKEPAGRYQSAGELAEDLRRYLAGKPIRARRLGVARRFGRWSRRHKAVVTAAAAILLTVVTVGAVTLREWSAARWERYERVVREAVGATEARKLPFRVIQERTGSADSLRTYMLGNPEVFFAGNTALDPLDDAVRALGEVAALYPRRPDAWYHRARALLLLGRRDDALADIRRALTATPGFEPAERVEAAILAGKELAEVEPGPDANALLGEEPYLGASLELLLARGIAAVEARDYWRAAAHFAAARALWPGLPEPALLLGKTYALTGQDALAEESFEAALTTSGSADAIAFDIASFCVTQLWHDRARPWLERVHEAGVRERAKCSILFWAHRWDEAIEAGENALRVDDQDSMAYAFLAEVLHDSGRVAEARVLLENARSLDPRNGYVHLVLGWTFGCAGNIQTAREHYDEAVRLDPGLRSAASNYLHVNLSGSGLYEEALREARMAVALDSEDAMALTGLAWSLLSTGSYDEALEAARGALERNQNLARAHGVTGWILVGKGETTSAFQAHERALELDGANGGRHNEYGFGLNRAGHLDHALQELREAAELFPEYAHPRSNAALIHWRRGNLEEAVRQYRLAIASPEPNHWLPRRLEVRLALGRVLDASGNTADAFSEYARILEDLDPGNPRALKRLAGICRRKSASVGNSSLDRLAAMVEARLRSGSKSPLLLQTLVLVRFRQEGGDVPCDLIETLEAHGDSAPYLAFEALLDAIPEESWSRDGSSKAPGGRFEYIEGRRLQRRGEAREAAEVFSRLCDRYEYETAPELLVRLVECLRMAGDPEQAVKRLNTALSGTWREEKALAYLWAAISLADLAVRPAKLLADVPDCSARHELRWLLARLAEGGTIRLACGGARYQGAGGTLWESDRFFLPERSDPPPPGTTDDLPLYRLFSGSGEVGRLPVGIVGTSDAPLYQNQRCFPRDEAPFLGYRVPVPPGNYRVTLHFAEVWFRVAGMRRFDVLLEGTRVLADHEPVAAGLDTAGKYAFVVAVEDGLLDLEFVPHAGDPSIAAIEIERIQ